jgi:hypothetical protein
MHCCGNPTLIDGLTKPHNPGIDYDLFAYWNQRRLDANEAAHNAIGREIQRPVNDYNADGNLTPPPVGPEFAEGWDDWGPFYTQTYMAFYGVDSSTVEMCSTTCDGRIGSKTAQYLTFYSSADFWISNRNAILDDQAEIFRRGVEGEPRPDCCDDPELSSRGFDESNHNWMVPYPEAYVIPFEGTGQRSDAEANRLAQWLLDNGIQVHRTTKDFSWKPAGSSVRTFVPERSYVVWMDQPFRGLALTALGAGQDVSDRITQLYAPRAPGATGSCGADTLEVRPATAVQARRPRHHQPEHAPRRPERHRRVVRADDAWAARGERRPVGAPVGGRRWAGRGAVHDAQRRRDARGLPGLPERPANGRGTSVCRPGGRRLVRARPGARAEHH